MENLDKQSWLQRMGLESWQPELVISGVVFWSSLSIPGLLNGFSDYLLANVASKHHDIANMILIYTNIAVFALIGTFGLHLVVRFMWVAMVGLNSVFPDGVLYEKIEESDYFKEEFEKDNPSALAFTEQLDDFSSILFAFSCSAASTFLGINFLIVIFYTTASVLIAVSGINLPASTPVAITFGLLIFSSLFFYIVCKVLFKRQLWAQKLYYHFTKKVAMFAGMGIVPGIYSYVYYTFSTHFSNKKTLTFTMIFTMLIAFLGGISIGLNRRVAKESLLKQGSHRATFNSYVTQSDFYEKLRPQGHRILWPIIPNDIIEGPFMKVFVPYFADERSLLRESCPSEDELGDKCFTEALRAYFTLSVNDSVYNEPYTLMRHPNANERGFISILPTKSFKDGQNNVSIRRVVNGDTSIAVIPFWFAR